MGLRITVEQGDIADAAVDAVVNAANSSLMGGGGVDGAIHRRGGPQILEACRALRAGSLAEGLPVGQAVATTAGNLRARWVIHTVGPVFSVEQDRTHLLASAFRECLQVADAIGAESVAFPAISAGVYRWPLDDVARVGVGTLENTPTRVREARFVLFTPAALEVFAEALARRPQE
ncbi:MAG TPA: O-acetyl-ADP-ribose deacetylase [Candidatus Limnocylindria bacterium]|nr:O-acetyl-ADP-ribose deacetylase [Candidatus Limnocylindria bacterium]